MDIMLGLVIIAAILTGGGLIAMWTLLAFGAHARRVRVAREQAAAAAAKPVVGASLRPVKRGDFR